MKDKRYTLWLRYRNTGWVPTITASGRVPTKTGRQLLNEFRRDYYGEMKWWKGNTRILPEGKTP